MDRKAANGQKEEALWCVFLMSVVMALIIVRTGVVCRSLSAALSPEEASQDAVSDIGRPPSPASPDDLYRAALAVLSLAEIAGQFLVVTTREVWELLNEPLGGPAPERLLNIAGLCDRRVPLPDTS